MSEVWWDEARAKLAELGALPEGWDSYGGIPPNDVACAHAQHVIRLLQTMRAGRPFLCPMSEGGLALEWHDDDGFAEIECLNTGAVSFGYYPDSDAVPMQVAASINTESNSATPPPDSYSIRQFPTARDGARR